MVDTQPIVPTNVSTPASPTPLSTPTRIVTAASLFDGHDASINVMRRILQSTGAEVIHLGHDRSVDQVVRTAIQEDADAIALTSYQGGHVEYMKYAYDLLNQYGSGHIRIFAGGGGTILDIEAKELHEYGIERIYSPDDGRAIGLQGMIDDVLARAQRVPDLLTETWQDAAATAFDHSRPLIDRSAALAKILTAIEHESPIAPELLKRAAEARQGRAVPPTLGITGTGGAGKSSLTDELLRRFLERNESSSVGIISVDPSRRRSGGALLGDRIRMNSIYSEQVFMRSVATRATNVSTAASLPSMIDVMTATGVDLVVIETSGIGQSGTEVVDLTDTALYVMTPEYGAASQLEKIDMLDFADIVAINKSDKPGADDALRDVQKQVQRNRQAWETAITDMPVYATVGSRYADEGTDRLFSALIGELYAGRTGLAISAEDAAQEAEASQQEYKVVRSKIVAPERVRYLAEIAETIRGYNTEVEVQAKIADAAYSIDRTRSLSDDEALVGKLDQMFDEQNSELDVAHRTTIEGWQDLVSAYSGDSYTYQVRGKDITVETSVASLSGLKVPRIALPQTNNWGDIVRWTSQENVPGSFPYTAGVFPFKRQGEAPARMFAGEGGPERTNRRFHYVSAAQPAKRLSTAFDSVTLYGADPHERPDIYGKIGNAGVNIATVDDAKRLYSGFDLCSPMTSVSMTINGPAAIVLAFFLNAAIDQQCERYLEETNSLHLIEEALAERYDAKGLERPKYEGELPEGNDGLGLKLLGLSGSDVIDPENYERIKGETLRAVRGTVQADIFKEDQAQNTCIFSTEFSLQLMGDVQQYFVDNSMRNFYSVSISGYHIAEAGANPITQLAFTLSNGFTYVEYYLNRGMDIEAFVKNFSFFFSNGLDPEYAVIGRVARRIWAKALRLRYGASDSAQKLKYHIQTSGRSLHAQEIQFNDIRTTLQALYALYDNCNSLHTNAYDEAITTPTEESVRRAMAIQLIINQELGSAKNENPNQGSFLIEQLTDMVEEAVLVEFERISDRGGVMGAMETMYQRHKIQEESLYYEGLKHSGELPIIGVNTFLDDDGSPTDDPPDVFRSSDEEKKLQIARVENQKQAYGDNAIDQIDELKEVALRGENVFTNLLEVAKVSSLGQITDAFYQVGGEYRRSA